MVPDQVGALLLRRRLEGEPGPEWLAHLSLAEYGALGYAEPGQLDEYFSFTFVRNPWHRPVLENRFRYAQGYSFREFVLRKLPMRDFSDAYRHVMAQHGCVCDESGEIVVDYLGRFENIQADLDEVCRRLGIAAGRFPHANRTVAKGWRARLAALFGINRPPSAAYESYFDPDTRRRVDELYGRGIELFGYECDVPARRTAPVGYTQAGS